jgi:trehalose-6-phosphate synthase
MPEAERRDRMAAMRQVVAEADIRAWGDAQLAAGRRAVAAAA